VAILSSPRDVLICGAEAEFEAARNFFYLQQLVPLNESIYYVEQILAFPFDLFSDFDLSAFFRVTVDNYRTAILLGITRVAADSDSGSLTLPKFKNRLPKLIRPEFRDAFQVLLREARWDRRTRKLVAKAGDIRNKTIAHLDADASLRRSQVSGLSFDEVKDLRDALNDLLDTVFYKPFGVEAMMLTAQHHPNVTHPPGSKPDIERLLDLIVDASDVLRMPEKVPESWQYYRVNLTSHQLERLNEYRRKFGLPDTS